MSRVLRTLLVSLIILSTLFSSIAFAGNETKDGYAPEIKHNEYKDTKTLVNGKEISDNIYENNFFIAGDDWYETYINCDGTTGYYVESVFNEALMKELDTPDDGSIAKLYQRYNKYNYSVVHGYKLGAENHLPVDTLVAIKGKDKNIAVNIAGVKVMYKYKEGEDYKYKGTNDSWYVYYPDNYETLTDEEKRPKPDANGKEWFEKGYIIGKDWKQVTEIPEGIHPKDSSAWPNELENDIAAKYPDGKWNDINSPWDVDDTLGDNELLKDKWPGWASVWPEDTTPENKFEWVWTPVFGRKKNGEGEYTTGKLNKVDTPVYIRNKVNFATIKYEAMTGGSVENNGDDTALYSDSTASGSKAVAGDGYKFLHWVDENGKIVSTEANFVPDKIVSATYYAVFEEPVTIKYEAKTGGTVSNKEESGLYSSQKLILAINFYTGLMKTVRLYLPRRILCQTR